MSDKYLTARISRNIIQMLKGQKKKKKIKPWFLSPVENGFWKHYCAYIRKEIGRNHCFISDRWACRSSPRSSLSCSWGCPCGTHWNHGPSWQQIFILTIVKINTNQTCESWVVRQISGSCYAESPARGHILLESNWGQHTGKKGTTLETTSRNFLTVLVGISRSAAQVWHTLCSKFHHFRDPLQFYNLHFSWF